MTTTHEAVVKQFRSGQAIDAIAAAIGYTPRAVRRILQKKDVAVPRFRAYVRTPPKPTARFQSRTDGEYCQCKRCTSLGYGDDAWHPATMDFWPTENGRLRYDLCRACVSEMKVNVHGVVPGRGAA